MTELTERANQLLAGITIKEPWRAVNVGNVHWGVAHGKYDFPTVVFAQCSYDGYGNGSSQGNAEFIAAAPDLVRELVAEVEQLRSHYCAYIDPEIGDLVRTVTTPVGWEDVVGVVVECDDDVVPGWFLVRWSNGEESYERARSLEPVSA